MSREPIIMQKSWSYSAAALFIIMAAGLMQAGGPPTIVTQKNRAFTPGTITVKVGDSIEFKNDDDVTHNAFSTSKGNEFNSKAQPPGSTASVTFKTAGQVDIHCAFHPKMLMTVTVK
jgi:plastocyanin